MKTVYVVAPSHEAFVKWTAKKDTDAGWRDLTDYVYIAPWRHQRIPKGGTAEFMFLKHWKSREDWRYLYNRALSLKAGRP